ncbi:MAG: CPBP family glutamic-type intramembrane protease [Spirochaetales bacterium]|nr:CPBP family glutamic-type intramembrane protease [Spirochaetales bacterium]
MYKKSYFFIMFFILFSTGIFAQNVFRTPIPVLPESDFTPVISKVADGSEDADSTDLSLQSQLKKDLAINQFLPGYWQIKHGNKAEGIAEMFSWPLMIVGNILLVDYLIDNDIFDSEFYTESNNYHYCWYSEGLENPSNKWEMYSALVLSSGASFLYSYSLYSAEEDYYNMVDPNYSKQYGETLSIGDVLAAPWQPENLLNFDFFPVYPLFAMLGTMDSSSFQDIVDYFKRDSVSILGADVHPVAGLAMALSASMLLANLSTTTEELTFRSHLLREKGIHLSSITFGAVHLANMTLPNTSVESTIFQALFATLFGYYAGYKTQENGYDFRRMIALHFWHNVTVMTLDYILNPDEAYYFTIGAEFSF